MGFFSLYLQNKNVDYLLKNNISSQSAKKIVGVQTHYRINSSHKFVYM
jgi:hypothetical protein